RQIRKALDGLRRLVPESDAPLAELRVTVRNGELFIERDTQLVEPSGQVVMEFSPKGLAEEARDTARRGLVRPLVPPEGEAARRHWTRYLELDASSRWADIARAWLEGPVDARE